MKNHTGNAEPPDPKLLAALLQLSPNPLIVVDATGGVTFASDAVKRALGPLGPNASAAAFFPHDMDSILAHLRRREPAVFLREVAVGNRIFEEYIWVRPDHDAALINAKDITELRHAKNEVREEAALLQAFVESPADTQVFALNREGCYIAFNTAHRQEMKQAFGVAIGAGMNMLGIINLPEVKAKTQRSIDRALAGRSFTEVEVLPEVGTWHEFNWSPICALNGEVQGVTAFIHDITRRKQIENALVESELKYRTLFESSDDAVMLLDNERFLDCNPAALRVFGYSAKEEFLGKHPAEVSPPRQADGRDSRSAARENIATAFKKGRSHFEWLHQRADGTVFPADVLLAPTDFHSRKVLQATVRDISERRRAEQALRESEERYRRIVESNAVGIVTADPDLRFTSANRRFCEMLGYTEEELGRMTLPDITHPDSVDQDRASVARVRDGEKPYYRTEKRYIRRDGNVVHAETTVFPIGAESEHPPRTLALVEDITERKQTEALLARYRDHLEELVRERTSELEAANRGLEAFSYSVSHDLRTPLRAIDGFAQAIIDDCGPQLDAKARGHLDRVRAAAGRMAELIDDLLNLARITHLPLERKPVNLSELARDIADELSRSAPDRTVEFVIPDGLAAQADPVLAAMVLRNLLNNAWKFTSRHSSARIEFGVTTADGEPVWFVSDDGAGFDMAYVGKLFQPFQRLHSDRDFAGSGIGLAIVQRIVLRHGGRVWIEGEVERGATCRFTLCPAPKEG
jgi:PAS domain S-box-containing protein